MHPDLELMTCGESTTDLHLDLAPRRFIIVDNTDILRITLSRLKLR